LETELAKMRKMTRTLAFKALILWIIGGSILVYQLTANLEANGSLFASHKEVLLKDGNFELKISKPISYAPLQTKASVSKEINNALVRLADHVIDAPDKKLLITGIYTLKAANESQQKGVGNARAEHLKEHLVSLGADPSNIFTSSKLGSDQDAIGQKIKGVKFSIIDQDRKVNVNPMMSDEPVTMINPTRFILPYYTRSFDRLIELEEELNGLIERALESPDMAIVVSISQEDRKSKALLDALHLYIKELTYGVEVNVVKEISVDESVSDSVKQNIEIDIGLKRFQNNLEFLGS